MPKQPTEEKPRRHTLTDAYRDSQDTIAQLLNRSTRQPVESVDLSRNAKGDVQIAVSAGVHEGETLEQAAERARAVYDALVEAYPHSSTTAAGDAS